MFPLRSVELFFIMFIRNHKYLSVYSVFWLSFLSLCGSNKPDVGVQRLVSTLAPVRVFLSHSSQIHLYFLLMICFIPILLFVCFLFADHSFSFMLSNISSYKKTVEKLMWMCQRAADEVKTLCSSNKKS